MIFKELKPGSSVEGTEIPAYRSEIKAEKYLYLLAGTHGDEVEGVYVLEKLFEWIKEQDDLEVPIVVIPILNPDGYRESRRVNSHCVDLNRNMPSSDWSAEYKKEKYNPGSDAGSEVENQFLIKLLEKFKPALTISIHSWKPFLNYNGNIRDITEFLHKYNGYPIDDDIGYKTTGSLGTYIPEKFKTGVLTFELPPISDTQSLQDIWEENEIGLKELLKSDLLKSYLF